MGVNTYPEMNAIIKNLLRDSEDNMLLYAAARIEELEQNQIPVRCIQCKHYEGLACCKLLGDCGGTNWFCGWGEPKEEET